MAREVLLTNARIQIRARVLKLTDRLRWAKAHAEPSDVAGVNKD